MTPTVLVVDDEPSIPDLIKIKFRKSIRSKKFNFLFALNGLEALDQLQKHPETEVVVTDINMPRMDGLALLREIQHSYPSIKTIVVSAYGDMENIRTSMNLGAIDFLTKPFDPKDLEDTIHKTFHVAQKYKKQLNQIHERETFLEDTLHQQKELAANYQKFVPNDFLELLQKEHISDIQLGDHVQKSMSLLSSNIRTFTSLSDILTIEENFKFLNSYLSHVIPVVHKHHGFVSKFYGDSLMALFGNTPDDALCTAYEMLDILSDYNQGRQRAGYVPISVSFGIDTGLLMLGTVGDSSRMESTVISECVSTVARIEHLAEIYETPLLISNEAFLGLSEPHPHTIRMIDFVKMKKNEAPIIIYEIFDKDPPQLRDKKLEAKIEFEKAWLAYYSQEFPEAFDLFKACLTNNPKDKVVKIYLERCEKFIEFDSV